LHLAGVRQRIRLNQQIQDKADDIHANVKSTALLFGDNSKPILSAFSVSFLSLLAYAGYLNSQGLPFYAISVGGAAAHLFWQIKGMKINDRADCWMRFRSNRDMGYLVWGGLMIDYLSKMLLC
jgi:4-hydroxybenzoate polyprenyltransferase